MTMTKHEIYCNNCENYLIHSPVGTTYKSPFKTKLDRDLTGQRTHQFYKCPGCEDIIYLRWVNRWYKDSFNQPPNPKTVFIYPERRNKQRVKKEFVNLPDSVNKPYSESIIAFNNKIYGLCVMGIRATLEAICLQKEIKEKGLYNKIDALGSLGLISKSQIDILHQCRIIGNDAAHEFVTPPTKTINVLIDTVEYIMGAIYELDAAGKMLTDYNENKKK